MQKTKHALILFLSVLFVACVTINIYFPAAAAEKAADRIIQDVWGTAAGQEPTTQAPAEEERVPAPETSLDAQPDHVSILISVLHFVTTPAYAQADLTISTPAIDTLTDSMKSRHSQLARYYASGAVGLTNNALLAVRDTTAIPLRERNTVKKLVSDENNDRNALYREIAKANGRPEWEASIRETFARRWIANARPGWWYQDSQGVWQQK